MHVFDLFYTDFIQVLSIWFPTNGIITYRDYFKQYLKRETTTTIMSYLRSAGQQKWNADTFHHHYILHIGFC